MKKTLWEKIISVLLTIAMMLGSMTALSGCFLFDDEGGGLLGKKYMKGTDAAKLMLANERLDAELVSRPVDIGLSSEITSGGTAYTEVWSKSPRRANASEGGEKSWSGFPAYNMTISTFDSFISNIDNFALGAAEDITVMKDKLGIVDTWVGSEQQAQMLRVFESGELLMTRSPDSFMLTYRYTDENANNVYEMYSSFDYGGGEGGISKMLLIPGIRYEYFYEHQNGFTDYVILDSSRGYWVSTRYSYFTQEDGSPCMNLETSVVKDGFCYSVSFSALKYMGEDGTLRLNSYIITDLTTGRDIMRVNQDEGGIDFELFYSAIKSGLTSVSATNYYADGSVYSTADVNKITTSAGVIKAEEHVMSYGGGEISFTGGDVSYDYGEEVYRGALRIEYERRDADIDDGLRALKAYISELGLTIYSDFDHISEAAGHASLFAEGFGDSFEWNGYKLGNVDNLVSARQVLLDEYDAARREINAVKDYELVGYMDAFSMETLPEFSGLTIDSMGSNSYADGRVTINGLSATLTDENLLTDTESYLIKIALAKCDEKGNPMSTNTLPIGSGSAVKAADGALSLDISGEFEIPKNLANGKYALVLYVATEAEGIRVSAPLTIGSFSSYDGTLESEAMDVTISASSEGFSAVYKIKNEISLTVKAEKSAYSYAEVLRMINIEILKKGSPHSDARLEYADGRAVEQGASLGTGRYRMICYLPTSDGQAEAYVYLTIE